MIYSHVYFLIVFLSVLFWFVLSMSVYVTQSYAAVLCATPTRTPGKKTRHQGSFVSGLIWRCVDKNIKKLN